MHATIAAIAAALILAAAIVWYAESNRYQMLRLTSDWVIVLDGRTGKAHMCIPDGNGEDLHLACYDERRRTKP